MQYYSCIGKDQRELLTERHVQAIWYDCTIRPEVMRTSQGARVRVVHPGEWNVSAGPDFKNAVIEVEMNDTRRLVRGDIEIHLSPRDWEAHGHGNDPRYKEVVAHITWFSGETPLSLPKNALSIAIGQQIAADPAFSPEQIDLTAYPFARLPSTERPCQQRLANDPDAAQALLGEAGRFRLKVKARRIGLLLSNRLCGRAQLFYEEIMAALGYRENTRAFRTIAQSVPYDRLVAEPENAAAALQGAATFVSWAHVALRPQNNPITRLAAAATLFTETDIFSALDREDFSPTGCREVLRQFTQRRLIGRGRAAAILANVVVPFALYEGRIKEPLDWLPPEDISQPVRLTAFRLLGRDHNPAAVYAKDGLRIQGLLQVYREFCLPVHPECETCYLSREGRLPEEDVHFEYGT